MPLDLTAIVLAGGRSVRMGRDKALLSLQGRPLIRHIYDVAADCSDRVIVVTPWPQRYCPVLPSTCHYIDEVPLSHTRTEPTGLNVPGGSQGPLVGFYRGLEAVKTKWVLLLACDLPYLRADTLQNWARQLEPLPASAVALLPKRAQRWEPLCGFYRRHCQVSLGQFIHAGGRSFQQWLQQQDVYQIPISNGEAAMLYNCNTPEDWSQLIPHQ